MTMFIGTYQAKLDDRGRLVFPSGLKEVMPAGGDMRFVVKKDLFQPCLQMFTYQEWEKQSTEVKARLNFFNREHADFWREYMRDRDVVEPDQKFARILINKQLLDSIGVIKDVVFLGNDFMIEIWAKESYDAARLSSDEYVKIAQGLPESK